MFTSLYRMYLRAASWTTAPGGDDDVFHKTRPHHAPHHVCTHTDTHHTHLDYIHSIKRRGPCFMLCCCCAQMPSRLPPWRPGALAAFQQASPVSQCQVRWRPYLDRPETWERCLRTVRMHLLFCLSSVTSVFPYRYTPPPIKAEFDWRNQTLVPFSGHGQSIVPSTCRAFRNALGLFDQDA